MSVKNCAICYFKNCDREGLPCIECLNPDSVLSKYLPVPDNNIDLLEMLEYMGTLPTKEAPVQNDPVNHPSHYTKGKIEVADFIADQKLNFDRGNAVKYICRAGSKDPKKEVEDLEKAIWYIKHEIKALKGETENA